MKPPLPAVLYGTGLLLAFGAGWVFKPADSRNAASVTVAAPPSGKLPPTSVKSANHLRPTAENWLDRASADLASVTAAMESGSANQVLLDKLDAILSISDASVRQPQWQTVLTAMRAEDAAGIQELFRTKAKDGRHFENEFAIFCHRWGQLDGSAAAQNIVAANAGNESIVFNLMMGWGSRDAEAALAWAAQQPGLSQDTVTAAIVEGLGRKSAREAEALVLANREAGNLKRIEGRIAAMMVAEAGVSGALPWFDQVASSDVPDKYKQANLETLLRITDQGADSSQSNQLARKYADRPWLPAAAGQQIGFSYLGEDPAAGINAIAAITSPDAREAGVRVVIAHWGPESTSEWLVANPRHPLFDSVTGQLVYDLAKTDPEAATIWSQQIKHPASRSTAERFIEGQRQLMEALRQPAFKSSPRATP